LTAIHTVYLGTGSNVGDLETNLGRACELLENEIGIVESKSFIYRTAAWGITDQADFYNQVICLKTKLKPTALLTKILETEIRMGRQRTEKWGPRIIDIDILFYDQRISKTTDLEIPHPFLQERRFVLQPLVDIAAELIHPVLNKTMAELLKTCPDSGEIKRI
jgi:2-amino-4-hydroxy-6-hydroxymethyldihydropteridine diphosphokinase